MTTTSPRDLADLRESIREVVRVQPVGPLGPNSLEIVMRGGATHLNGTEVDELTDAVLAVVGPHVEALEAQVERACRDGVLSLVQLSEQLGFALPWANLLEAGARLGSPGEIEAAVRDLMDEGVLETSPQGLRFALAALAPQPAATQEGRRVSYYDTVRAMHPSPELLAAVDAAEAKDTEAGAGDR